MNNSSNTYCLPDSRSFVINPDPNSKDWNDKCAFIQTIGTEEMRYNKIFTAEVIRLLATGMIKVKEGGKRLTKNELIEGFEKLIAEKKALGAARLDDLNKLIQNTGYNHQVLDNLLASLSGQELADNIQTSLEVSGFADSTITKTYLPDIYKKIRLRDNPDNEEVVRLLKRMYRETNVKVNKETDAVVVVNSSNVRPIKTTPLDNFINKLDIAKANWKELSVFLALTTGRRMAEIHGISTKFEYVNSDTVLFTGQLKTKDRSVGSFPYEIHTFCDAERVVKAWERLSILRSPLVPEMVNKLLSKALSSELPLSLKAIFEESGITKYKDMRDIYATRMVEFCPVNMITNAFVGRCMGHSEDDLKTANTYQKIRIID